MGETYRHIELGRAHRNSNGYSKDQEIQYWDRASLPGASGGNSTYGDEESKLSREAQDLICHYAPARYLCNLMDSDWAIDHVTLFDFTQMLGEDGMEKINTHILRQAIKEGLADPSSLMSDTTAQEAKIPYPNEVGLMSRYASMMGKCLKKSGGKFTKVKKKLKKENSLPNKKIPHPISSLKY